MDPMEFGQPDEQGRAPEKSRYFNTRYVSFLGNMYDETDVGLSYGEGLKQRIRCMRNTLLLVCRRIKTGGTIVVTMELPPFHPLMYFLDRLFRECFETVKLCMCDSTKTCESYFVCQNYTNMRDQFQISELEYFLTAPDRHWDVEDILNWTLSIEQLTLQRKLALGMWNKAINRMLPKVQNSHKNMWNPMARDPNAGKKKKKAAQGSPKAKGKAKAKGSAHHDSVQSGEGAESHQNSVQESVPPEKPKSS